MTEDETREILKRLYGDEQIRRRLLASAARFFGKSTTESRMGLDAEQLVQEAFTVVLDKGFPADETNYEAWLMTLVRNLGIGSVFRRGNTATKHAPTLATDRVEPDPTADQVNRQLEHGNTHRVVNEAVDALPHRGRDVARAMLDDPERTATEIGDELGASRSTVERAKKTIRSDPDLRALAEQLHLANPEEPPRPLQEHP